MSRNKDSREERLHNDPFSQFMFGRKDQKQPTSLSAQSLPGNLEKYLNEIDVNLLYENIDLLMTTAKQLKPLYEQLSPVIMQFIKKNK